MHRLGGTNLDFDTCNLVGHITLSIVLVESGNVKS